MTGPEFLADLKLRLNRPETDDLYDDDELYGHGDRAQLYYYRQIAQHDPNTLIEVETITSSDGGRTYPLPDPGHHLGNLEVWTPPGPPDGGTSGVGRRIFPALPDAYRLGFYTKRRDDDDPEKLDLILTTDKTYTPGLYIRWIPANPPELGAEQGLVLPAYMNDMVVWRAAYEAASKPGFLGDRNYMEKRAREEWRGADDDATDTGVLGALRRSAADRGLETDVGPDERWWRRITSAPIS